jgi:hypothetical protein
MTTIVVSPSQVVEETPSSEMIQLQVLVKEEDWVGLFDQVEVWRSRDTINGPYEELTAEKWLRARIPKDAADAPSTPVAGPFAVASGKTLQLKVNETDDLVITVAGVDPMTFGQIAGQITAQGQLKVRSYVTTAGELVVETTEPGTGAVLRVVGGDVAALVGLPMTEPEGLAYGRDARIALKRGTEEYLFTDVRGSTAYFYKTRFRNRLTMAVSEFSHPFSVGQALGISSANIVCGYIDLVDMNGKPLAYRMVSVHNRFQGELVENKFIAGRDETKLTDTCGHASFTLVRGCTATVAISGTDIARDILVPTDPTVKTFNLLDPDVGTGEDIFKVQVPQIVYAERRSL